MREVDYARFVEVWTRSSSPNDVGRELGLPKWYVADLAIRLRTRGVKLKKFRHRQVTAPSRWSRRQPKSVLRDDTVESDLPDPVLHLRPALAVERSDPSSEMIAPTGWWREASSSSVDPCWDPLGESTGTPWDARFMVDTTQGDLEALRLLGFDIAPDGSLEWATCER